MSRWTPRATPPPLVAQAVHLWRMRLNYIASRPTYAPTRLRLKEPPSHHTAAPPLAPQRKLIGANLQRTLLGLYLGLSPEVLTFIRGAHGKPALKPINTDSTLEFNLTYTDEWVIMAIARLHPVGVDAERLQELPFQEMVTAHFSPAEIEEWHALPQALKAKGFFRTWTQKEAYLKATGEGLMRPLQSFSVQVDPRQPAALIATENKGTHPWYLTAFDLETDTILTLATKGPPSELILSEFFASACPEKADRNLS